MKAIILAGGKGARLAPYTALLPKPLMPIGDMPVLELLLRQMRQHGVTEVVLAVNHLHHLISSFFGDGGALGVKLTYSIESAPLGTAGPIAANLLALSDDFLVSNGDLLTNLDIGAMVRTHKARGAAATIATQHRTTKMEFGALTVDPDGRVREYLEKPVLDFKACMGIYTLSRAAIAPLLKPNTYLDMPDLIRGLIDRDQPVHSYADNCIWLDIGHPEDYAKAQEMFERDREVFLPERICS